MPNVDPVILKLEADLRDYKRDLAGAQRLTDDKLDAIEKRGARMGASLKSGFSMAGAAAAAFAGSIVAEKLTQAIQVGLEYASALGEQAQQLGITTSALQEYHYAASQAGLSNEEMDQALGQLTRRIGEAASGTKAQAEAFEKLGLSVKGANGEVINAADAIPNIAEALQRITSPAERAAILMDLFGRAGQKLEPLLAGGSAAVNQLRNAAHELGIVLSEDQIQRADETADKLAAVKQVLQANIAGAVADNANSILQLANALAQVVVWAGKAASAWQAWRYQVAARQEQSRADGWFTSAADKQIAQSNANRLNAEAARLNGTQDQSGSFRDYNAKPLFPDGVGGSKPTAGGVSGVSPPKVSRGGGGGVGGGSARSGPSAADIARDAARNAAQFADELGRLQVDLLRSEAEYTGAIAAKRDAQNAAIAQELKAYSERVRLDSDLTETQRSALIAAKQSLAEREKDIVLQEYNRAFIQKQAEIEQAAMQSQADALEVQGALATTLRARRDAELAMFDLAERLKDAELDRILAVEATGSSAWENAKAEKAALAATRAGRKEIVSRSSEGPLAAYTRELNNADTDTMVQGFVVDELKSVRDSIHSAISDVIGTKDPLINGLLNMLIDQIIMKPLANALSGVSGGGGGGIAGIAASIVGSIFGGRASGGHVNAGQMYRVNEGAGSGRVEGFVPQGSGHVIPLGKMNTLQGGSGATVVQHFNLDARGAVMTQDIVNQINAMGQQAAIAGAKGGHALAQRDLANMQRPKL